MICDKDTYEKQDFKNKKPILKERRTYQMFNINRCGGKNNLPKSL
jgi:hypothetical protein